MLVYQDIIKIHFNNVNLFFFLFVVYIRDQFDCIRSVHSMLFLLSYCIASAHALCRVYHSKKLLI